MGLGSQQRDLPLRSANLGDYDPAPTGQNLLAFSPSVSNRSWIMQTISRATVMLVTLAALAWAVARFGPIEAVRPLTSRTIELADKLLGRHGGQPRSVRQPLSEPNWSQPLVLTANPTDGKPSPAMPAPLQAAAATMPAAPVSVVVAALESLGAQQVMVERWGRGKLHRVSCELPLSGSSSISRHFESVAVNRADAALGVLAEIRVWRDQHDRLSSLPQ